MDHQDQDNRRCATEPLVRAAKRGDDHAFYELMHLHKSKLYRMAWTYLRDEQDALEAVQETVCRAYNKVKKLRDEKFFTTWLIRILLNVCMDELRRKGKQSPTLADIHVDLAEQQAMFRPAPQAVSVEERLELEMMVDRLGDQEKQIILLKYYEDMTINDIAKVLHCPPGTIKTRLHRALQALREMMGKGSESHG